MKTSAPFTKKQVKRIHANYIQLSSRICHLLNFNHSVWAHRTISLLIFYTLYLSLNVAHSHTHTNIYILYNSPQHNLKKKRKYFWYRIQNEKNFKQAEIISPIKQLQNRCIVFIVSENSSIYKIKLCTYEVHLTSIRQCVSSPHYTPKVVKQRVAITWKQD